MTKVTVSRSWLGAAFGPQPRPGDLPDDIRDALIAWLVPDPHEISDGHHTFAELYTHRHFLFIALLRSWPSLAWRARRHADGAMFGVGPDDPDDPPWFIAGLHLPTGDITYHLPTGLWELLDADGITTLDRAPEWDGHASADVVERLALWHPDVTSV